MAKVRLNIQLDEQMKAFCQAKAEELGISMNGFINVALAQYKMQNDSLGLLGRIFTEGDKLGIGE
jgi:antitoxin component of RelBE/YafQ-DinJ toxin-antitoxin module